MAGPPPLFSLPDKCMQVTMGSDFRLPRLQLVTAPHRTASRAPVTSHVGSHGIEESNLCSGMFPFSTYELLCSLVCSPRLSSRLLPGHDLVTFLAEEELVLSKALSLSIYSMVKIEGPGYGLRTKTAEDESLGIERSFGMAACCSVDAHL